MSSLTPIVSSGGQAASAQLISSQPPSSGVIISGAHSALLAVLVEAGGLAVMVFVAGTDDSIASLVLLFMLGIFLLFLVMHPNEVATIVSKLTARGSQLGA